MYAVVVDPYGTTTSTTTRPCSVTIELDGIECADTTTTTTLQPTTTTTTTPTTTTTTTAALPYRASLSVGPGPDYNMATDINIIGQLHLLFWKGTTSSLFLFLQGDRGL